MLKRFLDLQLTIVELVRILTSKTKLSLISDGEVRNIIYM